MVDVVVDVLVDVVVDVVVDVLVDLVDVVEVRASVRSLQRTPAHRSEDCSPEY